MAKIAFTTLLKTTFREWLADRAPQLGAALAFYSVLSLGPLLLIAIAIAGLAFGEDAATGQIVAQMRGLIGEQGAEAIQAIINNANKPEEGVIATLVGIITLLIGASGVFGQLQDAFNTIWNVRPPSGQPILHLLKVRFLSFSLVLGIGFLLMISLIISAILTGFGDYFLTRWPYLAPALQLLNTSVSFAIITVLFALMFKILPDIHIEWRDVWHGALLTSLLFSIGKYAIGLYLGQSAIASSYGAAGSLVVLLIWIYYSSQIIFFGAEFTQVYSRQRLGKGCQAPQKYA